MNPLYNYRPFIYREREDLDEFLDEHPIWGEFYKFLLERFEHDNLNFFNVPILRIFNEAYFQAIKISLDKHPEADIEKNYFGVAYRNLRNIEVSNLCFGMVYEIFVCMENRPRNINYFCTEFAKSSFRSKFMKYFTGFQGCVVGDDFNLKPQPEKPEKIRFSVFNDLESERYTWEMITEGFEDLDTIKEIVSFWEDKNDKLKIIDIIEKEYDAKVEFELSQGFTRHKEIEDFQAKFFNQLRNEVQASLPDDKKIVSTPNETTEIEKLKIEIARLNADIALLNREIVELNKDNAQLRLLNEKDEDAISREVKRLNAIIEQLRNSKGKSDDAQAFDKFIGKLVEYLEGKPSSDNQSINFVKLMLYETLVGELTKAQLNKIRKLGNKETSINVEKVIDINNNNEVKINGAK